MAQAIPLITAAVGAGATIYSSVKASEAQREASAAQAAAAQESRDSTRLTVDRERSALQAEAARNAGSRRAPRGRKLLLEERSVLA